MPHARRSTASGVDPSALHAVAITGQWGSTVPVDAAGQPVGEVLLWADTRAAKHVPDVIGGPISIQGFSPFKVLPWVRRTGGAPSPSGADPTGHSLLLQRELTDVYARTVTLLEPVDYLGMRFTGRAAATPASMVLAWMTDNRMGREPAYDPGLIRRAQRDADRAAAADPDRVGPRTPAGRRGRPARRACRVRRWSPGSRTSMPPSSAVGPSSPSRPT